MCWCCDNGRGGGSDDNDDAVLTGLCGQESVGDGGCRKKDERKAKEKTDRLQKRRFGREQIGGTGLERSN